MKSIPHLIKAGDTSILLGQIEPEPPKVDCRVWAEDNYQHVLSILKEVRRIDINRYINGEAPLLPLELKKDLNDFIMLNEQEK